MKINDTVARILLVVSVVVMAYAVSFSFVLCAVALVLSWLFLRKEQHIWETWKNQLSKSVVAISAFFSLFIFLKMRTSGESFYTFLEVHIPTMSHTTAGLCLSALSVLICLISFPAIVTIALTVRMPLSYENIGGGVH